MIKWLLLPAGLVASCIGIAAYGDWNFRIETDSLIRQLLVDESESPELEPNEAKDALPDTVVTYLKRALPRKNELDVSKTPTHATIKQRGLIAMAPHSWTSFEATKVVSLPPKLHRGYVWTCVLKLFGGLVRFYIRDSLVGGQRELLEVRRHGLTLLHPQVNGKAESYGSLFGLISIGRFYGEPSVNLSSLLRYLAESIWTPQALTPRNGCRWTPAGDLEGLPAYTAEIEDRTSPDAARILLTFDPDSKMPKDLLIPSRPRMVGTEMEPTDMGGICGEPREFGGVVVPSYQKAWWVVGGERLEMWKARVVGIEWGY